MNFFNNNLGICALIVYVCFVLIGLINDYRNIYSRNNTTCLEVYGNFFFFFEN